MSLASRSMYVSLNQRIWTAQVSDRGLASGLERSNDAENRTMKVIKQLSKTDYLLPIRRVAQLGRDQHERLTLPGIMKGQQLLATKLFDEYAAIQGQIKDNFYMEVRRFSEDLYPRIMQEAKNRFGNAYRPEDFPAPERIKSYFEYNIRTAPVPDTGNWLLEDVDMEDMNRLRNDIENEKNDTFRHATKELFERTQAILENLAKQAKDYTDGPGSGALLRDVTINSVKDMAVLVTSMNIVGDPTLDVVGNEMIAKFGELEGKEVRKDQSLRNSIAASANELLAKLKGVAR